MDDSSQQDSTKKKSTASTNMHRLIISPKPCRINQEIKAKADPRKSIPERGQKRAYHIIRYRPIYRIMHSSRSSSRPAELGRKEKERKKIKGSFTYSWTRRHGQNPRQAFEFTCTCSSSDNERDQRNIPIHTGRQKRKCGTFSVDNQNNAYCSCITAANSEASSCWLLPHMLIHVILWEAQM